MSRPSLRFSDLLRAPPAPESLPQEFAVVAASHREVYEAAAAAAGSDGTWKNFALAFEALHLARRQSKAFEFVYEAAPGVGLSRWIRDEAARPLAADCQALGAGSARQSTVARAGELAAVLQTLSIVRPAEEVLVPPPDADAMAEARLLSGLACVVVDRHLLSEGAAARAKDAAKMVLTEMYHRTLSEGGLRSSPSARFCVVSSFETALARELDAARLTDDVCAGPLALSVKKISLLVDARRVGESVSRDALDCFKYPQGTADMLGLAAEAVLGAADFIGRHVSLVRARPAPPR